MTFQWSNNIGKDIIKHYNHYLENPHHRLYSWDHCFKYFNEHKQNIDLCALNLGFYLASWGMYRGSTFSLQRDYKIHTNCVEIILKTEYQKLKEITPNDYVDDESKIGLLFKLKDEIVESYKGHKEDKQKVSDTLVTKILLGTLACVPAYDDYFKVGLKRCSINSKFTEESFKLLMKECIKHKHVYRNLSDNLKVDGKRINYPAFKIIDMYYWVLAARGKDKKYIIK